MAIYSLRLLPVGKTTQRQPYTAAAHIRYIMRGGAVSHHMAARMPGSAREAIRWMRAEERADRKNARVADKLVLALPIELTPQQQAELVWSFAEALTQGRASWFAAIHANGKDQKNPHCHLLVRDRDVATGERVVMFSAGTKEIKLRAHRGQRPPTTLKMIRELWASHANVALEGAGRRERIDHRRLIEQGEFRPAQVHEGPNVRAMHGRGVRPVSKERVVRNPAIRRKGMPATRVVAYGEIDQGLSRVEYNATLKDAPELSLTEILAREARSAPVRRPSRENGGRGR
ncbi:MobA/MobL family protein [Hyphomicrobium sp. B1]|uniref:MobA/MobL family protein n=1 Tax=Hyphomicrobium sp. B1 TaxID=3075651 RepID=UPI003C2BF2F3